MLLADELDWLIVEEELALNRHCEMGRQEALPCKVQPSAQIYIQLPLVSWHSWPVNGQEPRLLEDPTLLAAELTTLELDEFAKLLEILELASAELL
jgi:hypothetical protein